MSLAHEQGIRQVVHQPLEAFQAGQEIETPQGHFHINGAQFAENLRQLWIAGHHDANTMRSLLAYLTGAEHFTKDIQVKQEKNPHTQEPQTSVLIEGLLVYFDQNSAV